VLNFPVTRLLWHTCNAFVQVLAKITINNNLFNKATSFWLRFVTKRDFDCEQVEQQTRQTELKHVSVVQLSEITPLDYLCVHRSFSKFHTDYST